MSGNYKPVNRKCVIVINKTQEKGNTTNQTGTWPGNAKRNKQELHFAPFSLRIENDSEYDKAQGKKKKETVVVGQKQRPTLSETF